MGTQEEPTEAIWSAFSGMRTRRSNSSVCSDWSSPYAIGRGLAHGHPQDPRPRATKFVTEAQSVAHRCGDTLSQLAEGDGPRSSPPVKVASRSLMPQETRSLMSGMGFHVAGYRDSGASGSRTFVYGPCQG